MEDLKGTIAALGEFVGGAGGLYVGPLDVSQVTGGEPGGWPYVSVE